MKNYIKQQLNAVAGLLDKLPTQLKPHFIKSLFQTSLGPDTLTHFEWKNVKPEKGGLTWIIGSMGNSVPSSLVKAATHSAVSLKPKTISFIDFSNNSKQGKTAYIMSHACKRAKAKHPHLSDYIELAEEFIGDKLSAWENIYSYLRRFFSVEFHKTSKFANQENQLIVAVNPRKQSFVDLSKRVDQMIIVGEDDCESSINLGSSKQFSLDRSSSSCIRTMLQNTKDIIEQRKVFLEGLDKHVLLVRHVALTDKERKDLRNTGFSIKSTIYHITNRFDSWQAIALIASEKLNLDGVDKKQLMEKALRLDANSNKLLVDFISRNLDGKVSGAESRYCKHVLKMYKDEPLDVVQKYERYYPYKEGMTQLEWVLESIKKDFSENGVSKIFEYSESKNRAGVETKHGQGIVISAL